MDSLISVIIPIYNAQKYLSRCMESITKQSYKNLEIILINDGSKDDSLVICEQYRKNDSRIVLVNQENKGVSYCRNYGVGIAKGEYIIFIDSDDYISDNMIETLYSEQKRENADMVQCGYQILYENNSISKNIYHEKLIESKEKILKFYFHNLELCVVPWNKLIRKELMKEIRFPLERRFEDEATMYKLFYSANKVVNLEELHYFYYQNEFSFMNQEAMSAKKIKDLIRAKEEMALFMTDKCPEIETEVWNEFLWILFMNYIKIIKGTDKDADFIWVRDKFIEYYDKMKKSRRIKRTTLFVLRYVPIAFKVKK